MALFPGGLSVLLQPSINDLSLIHIYPGQQNGCQTVLAKGAGGQIAGIPAGSS